MDFPACPLEMGDLALLPVTAPRPMSEVFFLSCCPPWPCPSPAACPLGPRLSSTPMSQAITPRTAWLQPGLCLLPWTPCPTVHSALCFQAGFLSSLQSPGEGVGEERSSLLGWGSTGTDFSQCHERGGFNNTNVLPYSSGH